MKFSQLLDMNMVPEWCNQYINYHKLNSMLNKAIESKSLKSVCKNSSDPYHKLLKFDQEFADYFTHECLLELKRIGEFHEDKLMEMRGKYRNLHDQMDQVLSSALYREMQLTSCSGLFDKSADCWLAKVAKSFKNPLACITRDAKQQSLNCCNSSGDCEKRDSAIWCCDVDQSATFNSRKTPLVAETITSQPKITTNNLIDGIDFSCNSNCNPQKAQKKQKVTELTSRVAKFLTPNKDSLSWLKQNSDKSHLTSSTSLCTSLDVSSLDAMRNSTGSLYSSSYLTDESLANSPLSLAKFSENNNRNVNSPSHCPPNQSKRKILKSYKRKIRHLKFAYKELYFSLVLFEQYTQLNYSGFEQILRKYDRMFASTSGRKFFNEVIQSANFYNDLHEIDQLIEGVEHLYTLHFENGNRRKAIETLQVPPNIYKPSSPILDFRVGFEFGMFVVSFVFVLIEAFSSTTSYDWLTVFRLYRSVLILIIFLFQTGISLVIWKHYKVNHVLIFELDPRKNLSYHHFFEFASILGTMWCISVLLFLYSEQFGIKPSICPLVIVLVIFMYLFNPTKTGQHQARFWLLKILARIFTAPFFPVRFVDFWIADQLVSIVPLFLDLEFLSCFYATDDVFSVTHLGKSHSTRCVTRNTQDLVIRTIVALFPAWTRCAQCLRRWRDENWRLHHLCNAGKYFCMVSVIVLSSVAQYNKTTFEFDTMRVIWIVSAIFTSSLTAFWDIYYDFGLFNSYDTRESKKPDAARENVNDGSELQFEIKKKDQGGHRRYPFLREKLVYPVWVYYFAIIEDWILRFGWVITISLTEFSGIEAGLVVSLLAPLEMFRRFVWNCIRLENEQLNNCGLFRAVRDIPLEVVAPIDEFHVEKVIIMMDSKDGTSIRNTRMMKRRTLKTDRVSFSEIDMYDNIFREPNGTKSP